MNEATIYPWVQLGEWVEIAPGAVIGGPGFGYERTPAGWEKKPERHGVVLADHVHVGANTCIDRGSYRDTVVGYGTKIDNLCHIAHNVQIGANCIIVAGAEISGSVEVGDDVWIGPNACVREHLKIGAGAMVGIGAVVVKDVPPGVTVVGNPARPLDEIKAGRKANRRALDEMWAEIARCEAALNFRGQANL